MRLHKANIAGLTSPGQQSEMKSILAGTWPPLKPLPVFKYETAEYRATIDFDKKRGEWVCRKTSLPSNEVQELRGGLAEITMALPHSQEEMLIAGAEPQEPELERETNRRLQAIREWREKYANGARYFELREFLSERQRMELDNSLRLSLTARQLQFNPQNAASVFDDLSIAGGRFAALIEFAKRKAANQRIASESGREEVAPEAECAVEYEGQSPEVSSGEFGLDVTNNDPLGRKQETSEPCADADEFPAVTIKDVFPDQEQAPLIDRLAHTTSRHFEIEDSDTMVEDPASLDSADSASLVEDPHSEEVHATAFAFAAQGRAGQPFVNRIEDADRIESSCWRFPALQISAFQVNVFAILFLFAATSFIVGLTVGRGPLGKRLREAPKSLLATDASSPNVPEREDQDDETTPQAPPAPVASSEDSGDTRKLADARPPEEKSKGNTAGSEDSTEVRSANSDSSPTIEPKSNTKPEVHSEPPGVMRPIVRSVSPRVNPGVAPSRRAVRSISSARRRHAPYRLASTIGATPQQPGPSAALVTVPSGGSQPFRVNFPAKPIGATSSLAMTSQLSVLIPPDPGFAVVHRPSRLEAGELASFVWPRYPGAGNRYGLAETIRVRATIGQLGQVQEVKFLGGSLSLLPATREALRRWRYQPTLLDKRPVQAQQDVTIEFRPERYSSQLSLQHPSHN